MNFRSFDLNLLRVLDAMLEWRNTTRVGEAIGLSQPAVSSALKRLREILGDPLFVREGNALAPSAFALALQAPVREALETLERALSGGGEFDPARSTRSFIIGASDFFQEALMPALADAVSRAAPNVRLKMLPAPTATFATMLTADAFDLVVSIATDTPDWIEKRLAFEAGNVVVARLGHPLLKGIEPGAAMPIDLFCGLAHVIFSVTGDFAHFEDGALARLGRARRVRFTVPGYFGVARVVGQSDLLGVVPARFAWSLAAPLGLVAYRLPFETSLIPLHLYWRKRDAANRELIWLRDLVLQTLSGLDERALAAPRGG